MCGCVGAGRGVLGGGQGLRTPDIQSGASPLTSVGSKMIT